MSMNFDEYLPQTSFSMFVKGMKALYDLLRKYHRRIKMLFIGMLILCVFDIIFPYLLKMIFDELPSAISQKSFSIKILCLLGGLFTVKFIHEFFWHFYHMINFIKLVIDAENDLPIRAQKKILELSAGFHEKENTGKKVAKIEKGIERSVWMIHALFWDFFPHIVFIVFNVIVVLLLDWRLGLGLIGSILPGLYLYQYTYNKYLDQWDIWEKDKEKATGMFCQSLININTVQSFVQEKREVSEHSAVRNSMRLLDKKVSIKMEKMFSGISFIFNVGFLGTIVYAIYLLSQNLITIGTLVYLITTGVVILRQVWALMGSYTMIVRRIYSVLRMKSLFDEKIEIQNSENAFIPDEYTGRFEFQNIEFSYPQKTQAVLRDFSLDLEPGQMLALVGKSGEGKTTLIKLLCRMYDVEKGAVTLDGANIKDLDCFWFRRLFAVVKQDVEIFDATIRQNICYAYPNADDKQIQEAIAAAHLKEALENKDRFPDGLETEIGERGIKLSGGEKQRIGIARAYVALLNGAKVLIFDEATSNLDSEAERAIQHMINNVRHKLGISIVAIAHRLSTIRCADLICVINNGQIAESGSHERLAAKNGLYAHLVELQQLGDLRGAEMIYVIENGQIVEIGSHEKLIAQSGLYAQIADQELFGDFEK